MMTENFLLKLIIYQGRDWRLTEDTSVSIRASLGKKEACTSPREYASPCPKFNEALCWEVDRKTLRAFKLNRVPIKVEFITNSHNCQKVLGYIILPLSTAAERVEVQAQWYKLLGGKFGSSKDAPHILMALSLTDADLEEKEESSEEEVLPEEEEELGDNEDDPTHTNGYSSSHQDNGEACGQNGHAYVADDHYDHSDDEEQQDAESASLESCEPEDEQGMYDDLSDAEGDAEAADGDEADDGEVLGGAYCDVSVSSDDSDSQPADTSESHGLRSEISFDDKNDPLANNVSAPVAAPPPLAAPATKLVVDDGEAAARNETLQSRSQCRDQLRRLSKEHRLSKVELSNNSLPHLDASFPSQLPLASTERSSVGGKRTLEHADLVNSTAKVRRLDTCSFNESWTDGGAAGTSACVSGLNGMDAIPRATLNSSVSRANVIGGILKKSGSEAALRKKPSSVMDDLLSISGTAASEKPVTPHPEADEPCRAELSEDNGFFRILPTDSQDLRKYLFSVTIVYAKDLNKVISEELWSKLKQDGLQFKYSLFGCSVFTDPFFTIDGHILLSERGTATVSSSQTQLSRYFGQNSFLSVDLIAGNVSLASCTVDLEKLGAVDYRQQVTVEGAYDLSAGRAFSKHAPNAHSALVGVCVELCEERRVDRRDSVYLARKSHKLGESVYDECRNAPSTSRHRGRRHQHQLGDSSSSASSGESSDSSDDLDRLVARLKGRSKTNSKQLMHAVRKKKRDYLQEAALEVEQWKEDQKQTFLMKWASREESLQKHLASQWCSKVKIFEGIFEQRLTGCQHLQDKLTEALDKLSIQENKLRDKEVKVNKKEKELTIELNKVRNNQHGEAIKSTMAENKKVELLESEVKKLREQQLCSEKASKIEMQEMFSLRKKLLEADDIRIMKRENESLKEQLDLTQEKKQYYKQQWTSAIANIHSIHTAQKHNSTSFHIDTKKSPNDSSNFGLKIRDLIEERKALTESGLYPHSHPMVREIDKKIKSVINSIQNT